ncbi:MAG: hypothetical protein ACJ8DC_10580 [Gemmatimonadales bacterium]
MRFARILLPVTFATLSLAGCGGESAQKQAETAAADSATRAADSVKRAETTGKPRLANVMIGKRVGPANLIAEPTFQFAPQETVYVSAAIQGSPGQATLAARWLAQGPKVLDSTAQSVTTGAKENALFRFAPPKGWKPGTYVVLLYLNGDSADSKAFAVRK